MIECKNFSLHFVLKTGRAQHCGSDTETVVDCIYYGGGGSGHL